MNGKKLIQLRKDKELTQEQLANELGISRSALSLYEIEKREPDLDLLRRMAMYFNVASDYLLDLTRDKLTLKARDADRQISFDNNVQNLRLCILASGYGYDKISEKLSISEELLEDYCNGMPIPLEILLELSAICKVSTDYLLGVSDIKREPWSGSDVYPFQYDPEISRRLKEECKGMASDHTFLTCCTDLEEDETFNLVEYGFLPHLNVITDIARFFGISADYLLNRTDSKLTISKEEEELLTSYRQLSPDYQKIALGKVIEQIKEQEKAAYMKNLSATQANEIDHIELDKLPKTGTDSGKSLA